MPRPDLARIGVQYRRIPILSVGADVYLDSRLIIEKLNQLYPSTAATSHQTVTTEARATESLLSKWTTNSGEIFAASIAIIPSDNQGFANPELLRDRKELMGTDNVNPERRAASRPEAILVMRRAFDFVENTLLADGREWVLGNEGGPSMADLEACWPLRMPVAMPGVLSGTGISREVYPRTFSWIERFNAAVHAAQKKHGKPESIKGEQAAEVITSSGSVGAETGFDEGDPVVQAKGLKKGQSVRIWPSDYGFTHKDEGQLVGVTRDEVVIETRAENGGRVFVHAPRVGFRIAPSSSKI
jgi:glutathione S-transferase